MAYTLDTAWVRQYEKQANHLAAQRDSRLRDTVMLKSVTGKSLELDNIGSVDSVVKPSRHANTPESEVPHTRRRANMIDYHWAEMIAKTDIARMLVNPREAYMKELAGAYNRRGDATIITALGGAAVEVDAAGATSNVTFPAAQTIAHGSTGMTVAKVRDAARKLKAAEVDMDYDDCFLVLTAQQEDELLSDNAVTSSDFSNIQRLIDGDLKGKFMGFYFRRSEQLPVASNVRDCFAYVKSGVCLGTALEMSVDVGTRRDKSNSEQIYAEWTHGAVRTEESKVVKIECSEA